MMSCSSAGSRGARRGRLRVIGGSTGGASQAGLQEQQCWPPARRRGLSGADSKLVTGSVLELWSARVQLPAENCTTQMLWPESSRETSIELAEIGLLFSAAGAFQPSRQGCLRSMGGKKDACLKMVRVGSFLLP